MSKNIYVGNLPFEFSEDDLTDLFSNYGNVTSVKIIKDSLSGRSRGFGFVEMSSDEEANNAIEKLNKFLISGREIVVNEAREKRERPKRNFSNRKSWERKKFRR